MRQVQARIIARIESEHVLRMIGRPQFVQTFAVEWPARRKTLGGSSRSLIGSDSEDVSCFSLVARRRHAGCGSPLGDFGTSGSQLRNEVTPVAETRGETDERLFWRFA